MTKTDARKNVVDINCTCQVSLDQLCPWKWRQWGIEFKSLYHLIDNRPTDEIVDGIELTIHWGLYRLLR